MTTTSRNVQLDVWGRVAARLRDEMHRAARAASPPPTHFKVTAVNPLILDELRGDLVLEEGDPDFVIDEALKTTRPAVGDVVIVDTDAHGDYVARGTIKDG